MQKQGFRVMFNRVLKFFFVSAILVGILAPSRTVAQPATAPQVLSELTVDHGGAEQMPVIYVHGWNDDGVAWGRGKRMKCGQIDTQLAPSPSTFLKSAGLSKTWAVQWWAYGDAPYAAPTTRAEDGYAFLVAAEALAAQANWYGDNNWSAQNRPCPSALDAISLGRSDAVPSLLIRNTYNDSGRIADHATDLLDLLRDQLRAGGTLGDYRQINIVTHSKGSLVTRAMLAMAADASIGDTEFVANAVYNAPPFAGSSAVPIAQQLFLDQTLTGEELFGNPWFRYSYGSTTRTVGEALEEFLDLMLRTGGVDGGLAQIIATLPPGSDIILNILKLSAYEVTGPAYWEAFSRTSEADRAANFISLIRPAVMGFSGLPSAPALNDLSPDAGHLARYRNTGVTKQFVTFGTIGQLGNTLFPCRPTGSGATWVLPCADTIASDLDLLHRDITTLVPNQDDLVVAAGSSLLPALTNGFGPAMTVLGSAPIWHGDTIDDPRNFGLEWLKVFVAPITALDLSGAIEITDAAARRYLVSENTTFRLTSRVVSVNGHALVATAAHHQYRTVPIGIADRGPSAWIDLPLDQTVTYAALQSAHDLQNIPFYLEWRAITPLGAREMIRSARFVISPPAPLIVSENFVTPNQAEVYQRPVNQLLSGTAVRSSFFPRGASPLLDTLLANPESEWVVRSPADKAYVGIFNNRGDVAYTWNDPNLTNPTRHTDVNALFVPLAGLVEGLHTLYYQTTNVLDQHSPIQRVAFLVDNTPPEISLFYRSDHSLGYVVGPGTPLRFEVQDIGSNGGTGLLTVPGNPGSTVPHNSTFTLGETNLAEEGSQAGLEGAMLTLTATGRDLVANNITEAIEVYYDWTPPSLTLTRVEGGLPLTEGYRVFTNTVQLALRAQDNAGIQPLVAIVTTADGGQLVSEPFALGLIGALPNDFAGVVPLAPGRNQVRIVGEDLAGNSTALEVLIDYSQALFDQEPLEVLTPRLSLDTCYTATGLRANCIDGDIEGWNSSFSGDVFAFSSNGTRFRQDDTNSKKDVFVWRNGSILLASSTTAGEQATGGDSRHPAISGNGRYVYFSSAATNLALSVVTGRFNLYVKDLTTGQIALISRTADGTPANVAATGSFFETATTYDGRYVAFESTLGTHVAGVSDTNNTRDIFLVDLDPNGDGNYFEENHVTYAISTIPDGSRTGNGLSRSPHISLDGRYLVYLTQATDINPVLATNGATRDAVLIKFDVTATGALVPGMRTVVPVNTTASNSSSMTGFGVEAVRVSPHNDTVAFTTQSNIVGTGDANSESLGKDVYLSLGEGMGTGNVTTRQIVWVSQANGLGAPQSSANVNEAFASLTLAADTHAPLRYTGVKVAWTSVQTNMELNDNNNVRDMFIRRDSFPFPTGFPVVNWIAPGQPSASPVEDGGLSGDGRYAYWVTGQSYIAPYSAGSMNVYRRRIEPIHNNTLTVTIIGQGSIQRLPEGVSSGATFVYSDTARVVLTANPAAGWAFVGWSGVDAAIDAAAEVAMNQSRAVTVTFAARSAPTASSFSITTAEDTESAGVAPTVIDADANDTHTYRIVDQPAHGVATVRDNQIFYQPVPNFYGSDQFTLQVTDRFGLNLSAPLLVAVTVTPTNDPPLAGTTTIVAPAGSGDIVITPDLSDPDDDDELVLSIAVPPTHGSATIEGKRLLYTPGTNFTGSDSFTYRVTDRAGLSATGVVILNIDNGSSSSQTYLPLIQR